MNEILLEFQPAKVATPDAGKPILTYSVYQYYAMERNFDEDSFLSLLTHKMLLLVSTYLLLYTNYNFILSKNHG